MLNTLLERGLNVVLCDKFRAYWKPKVMAEYLEGAATFSKQRESTLNITDTIQTQFKALFVNFCVYMLTLADANFSLYALHAEDPSSSVHKLFLVVLKFFPVAELNQLIANKISTLHPPVFRSRFPFFVYIYELMEKQVELSKKSENLQVDVLADRSLQSRFSHEVTPVAELIAVMLSNIKPFLKSEVSHTLLCT